jgi:hypothetical protein
LVTTIDDHPLSPAPSFAPDQSPRLLVHARQSKLIGLWAAAKMGLVGLEAQAYAKSIVRADVEKVEQNGVLRKIARDLSDHGIVASEEEVHQEMEHLFPVEHH